MTMLTTFAPPARQTVIRAGLLASEGGATRLGDGYFLLALAESQPFTSPVDLGVTAAMVRAQLGAQTPRRHDGDLLATLGIDLDEVRRRVLDAMSARLDDPVPSADIADNRDGGRLHLHSHAKSRAAGRQELLVFNIPAPAPRLGAGRIPAADAALPYVMSDRGDIVAILWADHDPLHAPPLPNVSNKILWVSR
jgi:hypothetical protein